MPGREFKASSLTETVVKALKRAIQAEEFTIQQATPRGMISKSLGEYQALLKHIEQLNLDVSLKSRDE